MRTRLAEATSLLALEILGTAAQKEPLHLQQGIIIASST